MRPGRLFTYTNIWSTTWSKLP